MGARVLQALVFISCLLCCSGTSVRVSYNGSSLTSLSADPLQFLRRNNVSHIQIFDENHGLLSVLCGKGIDVDLYMSMKNMMKASKSRALALAWVRREVASFTGCMNISHIIISNELMKKNHVDLLLPTLKAIDSALGSLNLKHDIKLSASFSWSFIEDCFREPHKPSYQNFRGALVQVMNFLHRPGSSLVISASCNEDLGLGNCSIGLTTRVISVIPDHQLPLQINLGSSSSSGPIDSVELGNRLSSVVEKMNGTNNRLLSLFVEKPRLYEFEHKQQVREEEQLFPSSRRDLSSGGFESIDTMNQKDAVKSLAAIPVIRLSSPIPVVNPTTTPPSPMTPITTTPPSPTTPITTTPPTTPTNTPATAPPTSSGQTWCVASPTASPTALQVALDYACGYGGTDCAPIQQGGSCFNPDTEKDHASYAFNDYYQKNPIPTSCDFGGTATLTNTDPSTSTCRYPSSSTSSSTPNTTTPNAPTAFGTPPPSDYGSTPPSVYGSTPPSVYGSTPPSGYGTDSSTLSDAATVLLSLPLVIISSIAIPLIAANHF